MSAAQLNHAVSVMLDASVIGALAKVRSLGVQVQVPTRIWTALIFTSLNQENAAAALDDLRAALHLAGDEHPPAP